MTNFSISRVFNAPRSLVFECWVNPSHFEKWSGPKGCTCKVLHADLRPGGHFLKEQHGPGDYHLYVKFVFRDIDPIDRLTYVTSICSAEGEIVANPMVPSWPRNLLNTILFEDDGEGTRVTARWDLLDATEEERDFFAKNCHDVGGKGWSGSFDRLERVIEDLRAAAK